ncbi:MAG: hypothetical protein NTZ87_03710 [Candidatus Nomurabacteria bacterium]|nr:hypothetical protein [Candidatus Nomurabacteria bacterium]
MKRFISYILILIILVGLFGPIAQVNAQALNNSSNTSQTFDPSFGVPSVDSPASAPTNYVQQNPPTQPTASTGSPTASSTTTSTATSSGDSAFKGAINDGCGVSPTTWFNGCLLLVFYYTIFQLPSWILWLSAQFFDVMINIGIGPSVTSASGFVPVAWAVVRDISNIFFILVLLYIAIQTILGLGHETKKMIAKVVIMALLINFSMFFTKIVIDSSNVLALIFYNKLDVSTQNANGSSRPSDPALQGGKDISGAMWKTFDATQLITQNTITLLKTTTVNGVKATSSDLPFALTLGIMVIAGAIMLFAAYAFFIAGLMFIGRLIELWMLIIFSPFAFMSWTVPKLAGVEYLGWDAWLKRLIATSFMAPIFMFFIYLIFMLLPNISKFTRGDTTTILGTILGILIPAIIVMAILLKATEFAKKGGGEFGEIALKVGGMALGAAALATGVGATGMIGGLAAKAASSKGLQDAAKGTGFGGAASRMALRTVNYGSKASFDIRNTPLGTLAKAGGIDLGKGKEGGYLQARADKVKKRQERAKQLEVGEDEESKQKLNTLKEDHQELLNEYSHDIKMLDERIKGARTNRDDLKKKSTSSTATQADKDAYEKSENKLAELKEHKKAIKSGTDFQPTEFSALRKEDEGKLKRYSTTAKKKVKFIDPETKEEKEKEYSINDYEDNLIPEAEHHIETENRSRKWAYAEREEKWNRFFTGGKYNKTDLGRRTVREANHKIRMESKIESSGGSKGHGGGGGGHAPAPKHEEKKEEKHEAPKGESGEHH